MVRLLLTDGTCISLFSHGHEIISLWIHSIYISIRSSKKLKALKRVNLEVPEKSELKVSRWHGWRFRKRSIFSWHIVFYRINSICIYLFAVSVFDSIKSITYFEHANRHYVIICWWHHSLIETWWHHGWGQTSGLLLHKEGCWSRQC